MKHRNNRESVYVGNKSLHSLESAVTGHWEGNKKETQMEWIGVKIKITTQNNQCMGRRTNNVLRTWVFWTQDGDFCISIQTGPDCKRPRDLAEPVHRQSCRHTYGDAATGPSFSDGAEDHGNPDHPGDQACRVPTDSVRQGCCRYAVKGPSVSECTEDSGKSDQPGDQVCRVFADSIHRQGCRYACGDATTGPSDSDGVDDHGRPADAVRWQSYGGADGMPKMRLPHHVRRGRRMR